MQLYLSKPKTFKVTDWVKSEFTGDEFRIFLNDSVVESFKATAGECFDVQPNGRSKTPITVKIQLPTTRGMKIAWALGFVHESTFAKSFADFQTRFLEIALSYNSNHFVCTFESDVYAFLLVEKQTPDGFKLQPIFTWVSDDISNENLKKLIKDYKIHCHLPLSCEEFLRVL